MTDWWKPATEHALAAWDRKWAEQQLRPTSGINNSAFYVNRMRAARDLMLDLTTEAVRSVEASAQRCTRSSDINNPVGTANAALEPILRKAKEAIRAQPTNAMAMGSETAYVESHVSKFIGEAEVAHKAQVNSLGTAIDQRLQQLVMSETAATQDRTERETDRKKITFWTKFAAIAAAASVIVGLIALWLKP
jgi:hypothetical protein